MFHSIRCHATIAHQRCSTEFGLDGQALAATEEIVRKQKRELAAAAAASEESVRQSTAERAAACGQHSALAAAHRHAVSVDS